ncbi:cell wall-binding repeat-containing protein [Herbiconiux liangxiaofengii]|uniref:cell wall-binding repeat-containing protein n=1 Tax=Herbiconiux liangxiaofengii TaxID=3342795 RepID=UPI0035B838D2
MKTLLSTRGALVASALAVLLATSAAVPASAASPAMGSTAVVADGSADLAALVIPSADDVRGNIHLADVGSVSGSPITWSSSNPAVVSDTVTETAEGSIAPGAVTRGSADVTVQLTASVEGQSKTFDLLVRAAAPAVDPAGYLFSYFAGESTDAGEEIYFGTSEGDSPLNWDELNGGQPVLDSEFGEKGLRDPMIIRSPEGDKFYIVATDLKIYPNGDFGRAQRTGSAYLEIWESTDLVTWSDQRHVKVSDEATVGNTWAPEAFYDETIGEYVVYWASNIYDASTPVSARDNFATYNRMMYSTTRDFVTFSEPQIWSDSKRGNGLGLIDSTVIQDGDTYYRFTKDEGTMNVLLQKSDSLRATSGDPMVVTDDPNAWSLVTREIGRNQSYTAIDGSTRTYTGGEGPTVFKDVRDDGTWWLFIDQPGYHGGVGYVAFRSTDKGLTWQVQDSSGLPGVPRHGTVLPVSAEEQARLRTAYNTIESVPTTTFAVETVQRNAPDLPRSVQATYTSGAVGTAPIVWDEIDPAAYARTGSFTVSGHVEGFATTLTATVTVVKAPSLDSGLVAKYALEESSGTTVADSSGNGRDAVVEGTPQWRGAEGFEFTGGSVATGNRIKLPNDLVTGLDDVSVSYDLWVDQGLPQNTMSFVVGNQSTANSGYLFVTARDYNNVFRGAITRTTGSAEQSSAGSALLPQGTWVRVTYTVAGGDSANPGVAKLYQDDTLVATNTGITTTPGAIGGGSTTFNYLGRSSWAADPLFDGRMRDFRVYDRALDAASIAILAGDGVEPQPEPEVSRIAGADRFEVSVNTSKAGWSDGSDTVYVASGEVFPDALSAASAATVADAPILLTTSGSLPSSVKAEIQRLGATDIVIVGGPKTISASVEAELKKLGTVTRIGGADRFEASRNIATHAFPDGAEVAVLATGLNFPDALSAGAAVAGRGPVVLVNGGASGLDAATKSLLTDLGVDEIAVAGGTASVSAGIQTDAAAIAETVRLGGADRFAASRAINAHFVTEAQNVLLATGSNFPDALSGSAFGPRTGAPLFTVQGTCIPAETLEQIMDLGAEQITLLGGEATLSPAVEQLQACASS